MNQAEPAKWWLCRGCWLSEEDQGSRHTARSSGRGYLFQNQPSGCVLQIYAGWSGAVGSRCAGSLLGHACTISSVLEGPGQGHVLLGVEIWINSHIDLPCPRDDHYEGILKWLLFFWLSLLDMMRENCREFRLGMWTFPDSSLAVEVFKQNWGSTWAARVQQWPGCGIGSWGSTGAGGGLTISWSYKSIS